MLQIIDVVYAFLVSLAFLTLSYFITEILLKITNNSNRDNIASFWKFYLGFVMLISLIAIFNTKGISILLPIPILIVYVIYHIKIDTPKPPFANNKNAIILGIVTLLVQFFLFLFLIDYTGNENIKYISGDFGIYYRSAERLIATGVESNNYAFPNNTIGNIIPYHYGDLWFYSVVIKLLPINPSAVFLVTFSILSFIFTTGIYQIALSKFPKVAESKLIYIFVFAGLFSGFRIFFPFFILPSAEPYTLAIFNWGKVMLLSTSLVGMVLVADSKNITYLVILTVIAGLLYINAIPTLYTALCLFILIKKIKNELTWKQVLLNLSSYGVGTIMYVVFLYKIVPHFFNVPNNASSESNNLVAHFLSMKYVKTAFHIFVGGWFQLFTIAPYIIILIIGSAIVIKKIGKEKYLKSSFDTAIYLLLLFISGLFCWAILFPVSVDTVQFFHNILAPLYSITIALVMMYIFYVVKNKILSFIVAATAIISVVISVNGTPFYVSEFNAKEWIKIKSFFSDINADNQHFVNIQPMKNYSYWSSKKTDMYVPLNILTYKFKNYHNVALVAPFITVSESDLYKSEELNDVRKSTFSLYYFNKKGKGMSDVEITQNFIKEYNSNYVVVIADTTLPHYLRVSVADSITLDQIKTTIYRLK